MTNCLKPGESFVEYETDEHVCQTIPERFERQVAKDPSHLAVHTKNHTLSYEQLNCAANAIAHTILAQRGAGHEPIGLLLENDAPMIEALLGVLKAGKTYVPLDPSLPQSRLSYILDDTQAPLLLTNGRNAALADSLTQGRIPLVNVDRLDRQSGADNPGICIAPDTPTWILYTSGSTGQPKGVLQTHRNVLHFVRNYTNGLFLSSADRMALLYSFGVNGAAHEMFSALLNGASLHTLDIKIEGVAALPGWLVQEQVTTYSSVPTVFRHFCETLKGTEQFPTLRFVKLIGEPVSKKEVELFQKYFASPCVLINRLGSTETGTIRWYFIDKKTRIDGSSVPVGYAVADNEVLLLDEQRKEVAAGEIGEIAVRSPYLSPGYWRKPDQTRKAFLTNSNDSDERTYLTGDLGRMMPDGCLLHLGRKDFQVKIRGHRIETGEVEMALLDVSGATQAIVMARDNDQGEPRLVAYLLMAGRTKPGVSSLRRALAERLPAYMIPSAYVMLDSFPAAPNGKVNRSALPMPSSSRPELENDFVAPSNEVELQLAQIWSSVLGVHPVGIHDDFFELGGHSLAAAQVVSRVLEKFHSELTIKSLFEAPTVAGIAQRLELQGPDEGRVRSPILPVSRAGGLSLSFAQERLWFLEQFAPNTAGYNIVSAIRIQGSLQTDILRQTLNALAQRHEALRTRFIERDGQPVQIVEESVVIELPQEDLTGFPESQREVEARRLATAEAQVPFDLTKAPLFRAKLLRLGVSDHVLVTVIHHIVSDGWSANVFARDFCSYFIAFFEKKPASVPDLPVQYADFAVWQRKSLQQDRLESHLSYWRNRLSGILPSELTPDRTRPPIQTYRGAKKSKVISSGTSNSLDALSRQERATLFMTLLTAFVIYLRRNTDRDDVLIGTDVANRSRVETENLIGFFVNLLPVHARVSGDPTFRELLRNVRDTMFEGYAHQDVPFDKLVAALNPRRDRSRNPLFQILFVLQSEPDYGRLPSLTVDTFDVDGGTARFDLVLFVAERNHQLTTTWNYNSDLFTEATIDRMTTQYEILLDSVAASPDSHVANLPVVAREPEKTEVTRVSSIKAARRKSVDLSQMKLVTSSHLTALETLPLVIQPFANDVDLLAWAKHNREWIEAELSKHGAILFRGFGVNSVQEFEGFATTICPELFVDYGDLPREQVGQKVYKSTPYPADKRILFHNESSHMHQWPMKQWFFCVEAAQSGGETPIVDCRKLYERIDPQILKRFEQGGIMYVRNFTDDLDVRWQNFFKTSERSEVEKYCRNACIDFEWKGQNGLRVRHVSPAVIKHPKTGAMLWFNQIQHWHLSCLDEATRKSLLSLFGAQDLPRSCYYGDGSPIEDSVIDHISEAYRKTAVEFPWRERDILMVDNMLVAHARNPYMGSRKIVVAMGEMMSLSKYENQNP